MSITVFFFFNQEQLMFLFWVLSILNKLILKGF